MIANDIIEEVAALLALMARKGVAIFEDRDGGFGLAAFGTAGPRMSTLPGILGKLGLTPLDLPKPPVATLIRAMERAGLIAAAAPRWGDEPVVYLLTAVGLRHGAQRAAAQDGATEPAPLRQHGGEPRPVVDFERARRVHLQQDKIRQHAQAMADARRRLEKQRGLVDSLPATGELSSLARSVLETMQRSYALMEAMHRLRCVRLKVIRA